MMSEARLLTGLWTTSHEVVTTSPSASRLLLPSSTTVAPTVTLVLAATLGTAV